MTASDARPPSDTGATGWHMHSGRAAYRDDQCALHDDDVNPARPVIVVDPAEPRAAEERIELARKALIATGYFTPEQVGDDIAPRITELFACSRRPGAAMTARCGCVLPFYLTDTPVQCACGRWYAMPDPRSTT